MISTQEIINKCELPNIDFTIWYNNRLRDERLKEIENEN